MKSQNTASSITAENYWDEAQNLSAVTDSDLNFQKHKAN